MANQGKRRWWCAAALVGVVAACTAPVAAHKAGPADVVDVQPEIAADVAVAADAVTTVDASADAALADSGSDADATGQGAKDAAAPIVLIADLPECVSCTWKPLPEMSKPRYRFNGAWLAGQFYVWGGITGIQGTPADVEASAERYDPQTNTWTMLPPSMLAPGGDNARLATDGKRLYVYRGTGPVPAAAFDPQTATWTALPAEGSPGIRDTPFVAWTGANLLVWGGVVPTPALPGATYDPAADVWLPIPDAPAKQDVAACSAWTGSQVLIAGLKSAPKLGLRYTPAAQLWQTFTAEPPLMPGYVPAPFDAPFAWHGCVAAADGFFAVGQNFSGEMYGPASRLVHFDADKLNYTDLVMPVIAKDQGLQPISMHLIGEWLLVVLIPVEETWAGVAYHITDGTWWRLPHPKFGTSRGEYASAVGDGRLYIAGGSGAIAEPLQQGLVWKDGYVLDGPWTTSAGKP